MNTTKRKKALPPVIACPECGKVVAVRCPVHDCSPKLPPEERARRVAALQAEYA